MGVSDARAGLAEGGGAETALCVGPGLFANISFWAPGILPGPRVLWPFALTALGSQRCDQEVDHGDPSLERQPVFTPEGGVP